MIQFVVPGNPQGKGRARIGKVGRFARMFTPEKTVAYESLVAMSAMEAKKDRPLLNGPVRVNLDVRCPIPKSWSGVKRRNAAEGSLKPTGRPDADNVAKAVLDALNGVLWHDDTQVTTLTVVKRYAAEPCVAVDVWEDE